MQPGRYHFKFFYDNLQEKENDIYSRQSALSLVVEMGLFIETAVSKQEW